MLSGTEAGTGRSLDVDVLDRVEDVLAEVSSVIDNDNDTVRTDQSVDNEDELSELIKRYKKNEATSTSGQDKRIDQSEDSPAVAELPSERGSVTFKPDGGVGSLTSSNDTMIRREKYLSSPERAITKPLKLREFSFANSSIEKAVSHYQRSKEEDLLISQSNANTDTETRQRPKSPLKSTAKFHVKKPKSLLVLAQDEGTKKAAVTAATRYASTSRVNDIKDVPLQKLTETASFRSETGQKLKRFEKKKLSFAEAYAEDIAAIMKTQDSKENEPKLEDRVDADSQVRVSLEYVRELEDQLHQLKRSIDKTIPDLEDVPSTSQSIGKKPLSLDNKKIVDRSKESSGFGAPDHDDGIRSAELKNFVSECLKENSLPKSRRFRMTILSDNDSVENSALPSDFSWMDKYRDETESKIKTEQKDYFERKKREFAHELSALTKDTKDSKIGNINDTDSDTWAATHSDDEDAYFYYRKNRMDGNIDVGDVAIDVNYFSDSELITQSDQYQFYYDEMFQDDMENGKENVSSNETSEELRRHFEKQRDQRRLILQQQQLELELLQRKKQTEEKNKKKREIRSKNLKKDAHQEEYYDPHANCMKFLGPRSQHGDGLPRPDYNSKAGIKGKGGRSKSISSHKDHSSRANVDTCNSTHGKKKSIMQCKMEQDLELKRQEEDAILQYKFIANPIPQSTYELRYTRYMAEAEEIRKRRVAIRREMITNMSKSFTRLSLYNRKSNSGTKTADTFQDTKTKSSFAKPFKAREVPSSFKEDKLDKLRYQSNMRKLVVKEEAKRKLEQSSLPPRMAFHERQRNKQTEDMSDGAALTSINVRTARDKMTTKDSKHPNDDLKKRLGQVPDFTRLHKDFERKLSLCRDSNRSKLTVPQEFILNGRDEKAQAERRLKATERRKKILKQIEQDAIEMREQRWPYLARRKDVDKRPSSANYTQTSFRYSETRSSQGRRNLVLDKIRSGAYDERAIREEKESRRHYDECRERATAWMKAQSRKLFSNTDSDPRTSIDAGERGTAMHIAARHKQIEEGVRSLVESTLLENDIYSDYNSIVKTSGALQAPDDVNASSDRNFRLIIDDESTHGVDDILGNVARFSIDDRETRDEDEGDIHTDNLKSELYVQEKTFHDTKVEDDYHDIRSTDAVVDIASVQDPDSASGSVNEFSRVPPSYEANLAEVERIVNDKTSVFQYPK